MKKPKPIKTFVLMTGAEFVNLMFRYAVEKRHLFEILDNGETVNVDVRFFRENGEAAGALKNVRVELTYRESAGSVA